MENRLKELRTERGMTQAELGAITKKSQQTVASWELGSRRPGIREMIILERFFEVPKEEIFFEAFNYKIELNN